MSSITNSRAGAERDWLIDPSGYVATIQKTDDGKSVQLTNGLISRTIRLQPNAATTSFLNVTTEEEFVRSVRPEAEVQIDSMTFPVGGLTGQPIHNYLLPKWIDEMQSEPDAFQFVDYQVGEIKARFPWKKHLEWMPEDRPWPPPGKSLTLNFKPGRIAEEHEYLRNITIRIHYDIYDGIPLVGKWISIMNGSNRTIIVDGFKSEILAVVEGESSVGVKKQWRYPNMTVETDYAFGGGTSTESCLGKSIFRESDPLYLTQVNYERKTPCLLVCRPQYGPAQEIKPGKEFESFRTFELLHDGWDRERKGLAQRKMYRTIAPWVTENPILMHVRRADDKSVRLAIDQCAEVGFEMIIMTFGSGFNPEDESEENILRMKTLADYAHSKGIALGGYSLLASRKVGGGNDVVMPEGMKPKFGNSPCLQSRWGRDYFRKLHQFYRKTGMDVLEHDGSYPGDVCASTEHPGHRGLDDSQWKQFAEIRDFYRWCRSQGIYLNVPDWYFLNGSNKTGMGYRETNWSLPRKQQEIIERQNIFDGTWEKTPSMGWMFVPLTQYHGGGAAATIEPLREHLPHYRQRLMNLFGAGVQACYRGPRLYDAPETRAIVKKWVDFYKKHRPILDSDIIHVRRPDGRKPDCILHVNPHLKEKGLAVVYNPTGQAVEEQLVLPLYYTGITNLALIREREGDPMEFQLDRQFKVTLPVRVKAYGMTWFVIKGLK
ncbi:MAG: alpha-galactosidase [Actinobacteria bacterium]|nr:alpha-galactosidase [Actinomycetota bacterium]